ncbi:type II toxin-antitoxin system RelE/ParE family toxin [Thermosynechococcaceae cyanobacterium BACA0444]|uniref:Type II toxin-antitoxin system RelE/ParE family toxin n=1 Tax=Pseudocalidococcus azoricus BACA0444 TaxID=2918990 RepID=A0AAE4FU32_9CYAN|nr:type II toxin-antitoxin system RelE/ParE family toxin [Pseudocalidococcus azoricus]MDS3860991.1 type II toxin-antitoxin system RelE/ParE family toxin [Pseudocalidococcus azoricus BACA0444]
MIRSFKCNETKKVFEGLKSRYFPPDIHATAQRKLLMVHAANKIQDLKIPPGNRLEKLVGDREGQYSIRINSQWRVCFNWTEGNADQVEIVDYHK